MMIAYDITGLEHIRVQSEAQAARAKGYITREEEHRIRLAYPTDFYTPNVYVRVGLFVSTMIILLFAFGLLALFVSVSGASGGSAYSILGIIFGCIGLGGLEFIIRSRRHFRSGVDDAALLLSVLMIAAGIYTMMERVDEATVSVLFLALTLFASLRYADRLMAAAAAFSALALVFYVTRSWWPVLGISILLYAAARRWTGNGRLTHHGPCLRLVEIVALLGIYASVNYWAVCNAVPLLLHRSLQDGEPGSFQPTQPLGWVCWIFTATIPLAYLYAGVRWKNRVLLRIGMVVSLVTILTVRFYRPLLPAEQAMTIGGILLIGVTYGLFRYLRHPKYGISSETPAPDPLTDPLQMEALVIAQTAASNVPTPPPSSGTQFGGGGFGGGGAGGDY
jgi:hypothetical protein